MAKLKDVAEESLGQGSEEMVQVSQADLKGLVATIGKLQQDLEAFKKGGAIELPTVKVRKAKVHLLNGKVVTAIGRAWELEDKFGEPEMRLEVFIGDKKHEVRYRDYKENGNGFESKECEIKEIKTLDSGENVLGYVNKIDVQYDSFRSEVVGQVPLKVTIPVYEYIMNVDDEEVAVNPLALN